MAFEVKSYKEQVSFYYRAPLRCRGSISRFARGYNRRFFVLQELVPGGCFCCYCHRYGTGLPAAFQATAPGSGGAGYYFVPGSPCLVNGRTASPVPAKEESGGRSFANSRSDY